MSSTRRVLVSRGTSRVSLLPPEVWGLIMDSLLSTERWYKRMHAESLIALCLVSRSFNVIATPRLYSHVGWPAFDTFQKRPQLLPFVKWIDIPRSKAEILRDEKWEWDLAEMKRLGLPAFPVHDEIPEAERNPQQLQSLPILVSFLPKLSALKTLEIRVGDDDEFWWSLIPDLSSLAVMLPPGLRGLRTIEISGRNLSSMLSARMVIRLMLLPNIRVLGLDSVGDGVWNEEERDQLRRMYRISTVSTLTISESTLNAESLNHLLRLPKTLFSTDIPIQSDTPLSIVKDVLKPHAETLDFLSLFNMECYDEARSDVLDNLRSFSALRELHIDMIYVLSDLTGRLFPFLPPQLDILQIVLNDDDEGMIDTFLRQITEVIRESPKLTKLQLLGPLADIIGEGVEDDCLDRGITLVVETW